ncbi:hypothetical protein MaudCBS49596_001273 [Microsporum audouinii]
MESSPLLLAHTHARNALHETRKSNPVAASEEHDLAAGEFATARQSTADPSAARTLRLLEDHHKQLAAIIRFQHENPPATDTERKLSDGVETSAPNPTANPATHKGPGLASAGPQQQLLLHQHPPRLLSQTSSGSRNSSIAGNLASARGIPSQRQHSNPVSPTVSAQNARARMAGSPVRARQQRDGKQVDHLSTIDSQASQQRRQGGKHSWVPPISPTRVTSQEYVSPQIKDTAIAGIRSITGDEPFRRFYSTFEGVISKLSAPLAFTSLPLGVDSSQPRLLAGQKAPAADTKTNTHSAVADFTSFSDKDPDVSKLVSSAALRAIKDKDGHFASHNPAESFYVVPTAGGMISYAGILSREEKEAVKDSMESVEDDFVDASENPPSPEETLHKSTTRLDRSTSLHSRKNKGDPSRPYKSVEELHMENEALRHLSDTLAKRLHMWEVNAQSSSLALQQSIRAMHNQHAILPSRQTSPAASAAGEAMPSVPNAGADLRIRELQEMIKNNERELEKVSRENEKLRAVVERYRERWEKLKEGARVRREGAGNGGGASKTPGRLNKDAKEREEEDPDKL